jgi:hypothetical protein
VRAAEEFARVTAGWYLALHGAPIPDRHFDLVLRSAGAGRWVGLSGGRRWGLSALADAVALAAEELGTATK